MQLQKTDKIGSYEIVPSCRKDILQILTSSHYCFDGNGELHPIYKYDECHRWHIGV